MGKGSLQFRHPREERGKREYLQIEPSQGFKAKCCPEGLTGTCPASLVLQDRVKGHNIKGEYLAGKPRPLGRGASKDPLLKQALLRWFLDFKRFGEGLFSFSKLPN
jgi:hypothetical protein